MIGITLKGCKQTGRECPNCGKTHKDTRGISNPDYIRKKREIMSVVNRRPDKIARQTATIKEGFASGRIVPWAKGLSPDTDDRVRSIQQKAFGRRAWNKGLTKDDPRVAKYIKYGQDHPQYGKRQSKRIRMIKSKKAKANWKNKDFVKRVIKSRNLKPNKAEQILFDILQKHIPNYWKYVGDFSFQIDGKYPDFISNNEKLIIELFGDYFHRGDDGSEKIKHYAKHGYRTLIIKASELHDSKSVMERVQEFINQK